MTQHASLARRIASVGYESLLVAAVVLCGGFVLAPLVTPAQPGASAPIVPGLAARALTLGAVVALTAIYFTASWSHGRCTLAMKTWRLRVVDAAGRPLDRKRAFARYVAAWIGPALALGAFALLQPIGLGAHAAWVVGLNFLWALVDPERQFLHDRIAGTRLVNVGV